MRAIRWCARCSPRSGSAWPRSGAPPTSPIDRELDLGRDRDRTVAIMRARTHAMLDAAWARGIRFIDAALRTVSPRSSSGRGSPGTPSAASSSRSSRSGVTNTSAGGGWTRRCTAQGALAGDVRAAVARELGALGTVPDLYLVHSVTPDSPALGDVALLDRLGALAATGVRVGISTSGPRQADALDAARELGDSPFSVVQATWNLLEPSVGPAFARAHDAGWFVVLKEAVANGRLSPSRAAGEPATARPRGIRRAVDRRVRCRRRSVAAMVRHRALGSVTRDQLDSNLASRTPTTDAAALAALAEEPSAYWATRNARDWT